ncbi:hypothetical protein BU15DRAFT_77802 [Melanogaster broomeanus]|nr:hypothetical protein BU15DRAFT_77802 [Melanogaster broomeanus]
MTAEAKDLLEKMLVKAPMERITYDEMRSHPFFEGIDWEKIESRLLISPFFPMWDAKSEEMAYRADDIERGRQYTPEADPLPQFSWTSPSNIKWHRHSPCMRKVIVLVRIVRRIPGWLSSCKGWHRKSPKNLPITSLSAQSPDEATPAVKARENTVMEDSEAREEWAIDSGTSISGGSSVLSALVSLPPSDYEQTLTDYIFPATAHHALQRRPVVSRSAGRRRSSRDPSFPTSPSLKTTLFASSHPAVLLVNFSQTPSSGNWLSTFDALFQQSETSRVPTGWK